VIDVDIDRSCFPSTSMIPTGSDEAEGFERGELGGKFAWGTAYTVIRPDRTLQGRVAVRVKIVRLLHFDHGPQWGPRPERGAPNMSWLHAHFSQDWPST